MPQFCILFYANYAIMAAQRGALVQCSPPKYAPADIQVCTDGSVPSLFCPGGAGVHVTCSKCNTSNSLFFSTGPIASSFTAETFALKQGLDWCTSHLMTCKFQSIFFSDRLPISPLYPFISSSCLLHKSLWNVGSLAYSLSNNTILNFQWVPPVTQFYPVMKKRIYLPKLVPLCPLTRSHALFPQSLPKSDIPNPTIGDVTSPTPI